MCDNAINLVFIEGVKGSLRTPPQVRNVCVVRIFLNKVEKEEEDGMLALVSLRRTIVENTEILIGENFSRAKSFVRHKLFTRPLRGVAYT